MGRILVRRSAAPAAGGRLNIACVGDSNTYGRESTDPGASTSYPGVLAGLLGLTLGVDVHNRGVSGLGSLDLPDVDWLIAADTNRNYLILQIGTNDANVEAQTAEQIVDTIEAYVDAREAKGWICRVATTTDVPAFSGEPSKAALLAAINEEIRTRFAGKVHDLFADPNIGLGGTSTDLFAPDGIHFKDAGFAYMAEQHFEMLDTSETRTPNPTLADGLEQGADLTLWGRDYNTITSTDRRTYDIFPLNAPHIFPSTGYFSHSFAEGDYLLTVRNELNGHPVVRFPGEAVNENGWLIVGDGHVIGEYVSEDSWLVEMLIRPANIFTSESIPYTNSGLLCDSSGNWGLFLKNDGGTKKVLAYANDDGAFDKFVEAAITEDTWWIVSFRHTGTHIGLCVTPLGGPTGSWVERTAGPIPVTGNLRLGKSTSFDNLFEGDLAEFSVRNAWSPTKFTSDLAYLQARYSP